jgi:hypothetical protein
MPRRLLTRHIESGKGDGNRVEREKLGFVAVRTGTALGSRGGDCDTGQRDEYFEKFAHGVTLCPTPGGVNCWVVDDHWAEVNAFSARAKAQRTTTL